MMITAAPELSEWESFYVIVGSSGAALVGLQFVVLTLLAERRDLTNRETLNAFGTPTVVHFAVALLISAILSAPWPTLHGTAVALVLCGVGGIGYALLVSRRARRQAGYSPSGEDWLWYILLPILAYGILAVAAMRLPSDEESALFVIGGVVLGLLLIGIRNAWDTVTYVVVESDGERKSAGTGTATGQRTAVGQETTGG